VRIDLYYFSGTGNTAWMVGRLTDRLRDLGDEVKATSCEEVEAAGVDPGAADVVGMAFPVHASFAPRVFRAFMKELPAGAGKPLFAVTTAGYWAGDTAWHAARTLAGKGYEPFLSGNVNVANNLHLPALSPLRVTAPDKLPDRLERAERKIERLAGLIHDQKRHFEGSDPSGRLLGVIQRAASQVMESRAFKGFHADETCTRCGWCAEHCPVQNISVSDAGVNFLGSCVICLRCYSFCPAQAIQLGEATRDADKYRRYHGPQGKTYPGGRGRRRLDVSGRETL
jgi:ferredoxin